MHSIPPITRFLLLANGAVFALQWLGFDSWLTQMFALWPLQGPFFPWQVVTYAFLHGDLWHIFFNMFAVYMFGGALESALGGRRFMQLYLASVIVAAIAQIVVNSYLMPAPYPTLGASGGVFGVLLGYAILYPNRRVQLLFPPIPMKAWLFVTLYGLLELYLGFSRHATGIAHFAHLGGMLGGFLAIWRFRRQHLN
jgi:membrane associated rhomboid family serine protease